MSCEVDHIVVGAATLDDGVRWCEQTLGVTPGPGGQHVFMGTHNRLLSLGGAAYPKTYLEIIAIDPQAQAPGRPRWFGLDEPALQASLQRGPRLLHMVARTEMLDMLRWGLVAAGQDPGLPIAASRETSEGPLRWQILVRDDGVLPLAGALPTLIQWEGRHPAASMPASGLSLARVKLSGLPDTLRDVLRLRRVDVAAGGPPAIEVELQTRRGTAILRSTD